MTFLEMLRAAQARNASMLCVGLDPEPTRFPGAMKDDAARIFDKRNLLLTWRGSQRGFPMTRPRPGRGGGEGHPLGSIQALETSGTT